MAEEYPQVTKWTTFFLYPFSFPAQQKDALSATLQKATDRWRRFTFSPTTGKEHFDELAYFFPYTKEFFTSQIDHFRFNLPEKGETEQLSSETTSPGVETAKASLTVSDHDEVAPELTEIRLHLLPLGIGILSLRVEGKTPLPFGRSLDFNSDFRYLTEAYTTQTLPQITLEIETKRIPENTDTQPGLRLLIHSFLQEIGGAPPSQLLDSHFLSNAQRQCLA